MMPMPLSVIGSLLPWSWTDSVSSSSPSSPWWLPSFFWSRLPMLLSLSRTKFQKFSKLGSFQNLSASTQISIKFETKKSTLLQFKMHIHEFLKIFSLLFDQQKFAGIRITRNYFYIGQQNFSIFGCLKVFFNWIKHIFSSFLNTPLPSNQSSIKEYYCPR